MRLRNHTNGAIGLCDVGNYFIAEKRTAAYLPRFFDLFGAPAETLGLYHAFSSARVESAIDSTTIVQSTLAPYNVTSGQNKSDKRNIRRIAS